MKKNFKAFLFLYFISHLLSSQTIEGTVTNINNKFLPVSNILIRDSNNTEIVSEYTFSKKGKYQIILKNKYKNLIIEIKTNGYEQKSVLIENPQKDKTYNINFV